MDRQGSPRAREAIRVEGATWRHLPRSRGDHCADCGCCDLGSADHHRHECVLSCAWFAGGTVVCQPCLVARIRDELHSLELAGVRVASNAREVLRRILDDLGDETRPPDLTSR